MSVLLPILEALLRYVFWYGLQLILRFRHYLIFGVICLFSSGKSRRELNSVNTLIHDYGSVFGYLVGASEKTTWHEPIFFLCNFPNSYSTIFRNNFFHYFDVFFSRTIVINIFSMSVFCKAHV